MGEVEPNFLIIGAAKSGTTSLHWMLAQHPDIFMSPIKETNYFAYDESRSDQPRFKVRSREAYLELFRGSSRYRARGEASPAYMEYEPAAARIHAELPDARLIAILREPAERAYSAYRMGLRLQKRAFDAKRAFAEDAKWLQPDAWAIRVGRYPERLRPFLERFPRDRIKLLLFDDLRDHPQRLLGEVFGFLGVDTVRVPWLSTRHNYGGTPRSAVVERALRPIGIARLLRKLPRLQGLGRRVRNVALASPQPLPEAVRARLNGFFRDDVLELEELLERDLSAWRGEVPEPSPQP